MLSLACLRQPPQDPVFLVKHTGTIDPAELFEEMKTDVADVEEDYLEMVRASFPRRSTIDSSPSGGDCLSEVSLKACFN